MTDFVYQMVETDPRTPVQNSAIRVCTPKETRAACGIEKYFISSENQPKVLEKHMKAFLCKH